MIPKILHYCWFGGNSIPEKGLVCIESWKKFCPDYEIKRWDESNYFTENLYAKEALKFKQWAFYSDYARLDIIYKYGGIYLDVDVELVKSLDYLLNNVCYLGMETSGYINTGLGFGAIKGDINIGKMLAQYDDIHFALDDDSFDKLPCPTRNTAPFLTYGYHMKCSSVQHLNHATIYPPEFFCPLDYYTNKLTLTENTFSIHHYHSSWKPEKERQFFQQEKKLGSYIGNKFAHYVIRFISLPYRVRKKIKEKGVKGSFFFLLNRLKSRI